MIAVTQRTCNLETTLKVTNWSQEEIEATSGDDNSDMRGLVDPRRRIQYVYEVYVEVVKLRMMAFGTGVLLQIRYDQYLLMKSCQNNYRCQQ